MCSWDFMANVIQTGKLEDRVIIACVWSYKKTSPWNIKIRNTNQDKVSKGGKQKIVDYSLSNHTRQTFSKTAKSGQIWIENWIDGLDIMVCGTQRQSLGKIISVEYLN